MCSLFLQIWTISAVLINLSGVGFLLAYPTCIIPALKSKDSDIKANVEETSWIGKFAKLIISIVVFKVLFKTQSLWI